MKKFNVTVSATDWCGYDEDFEVEAESEDHAAELAEALFIEHWDLLQHAESGDYGVSYEDFDDDGEPIDHLTGIITNVHS